MHRPAVVLGDIHGESGKLTRLLKQIRDRFSVNVDIYHVGDLIDRGPDSKGVLDICIREGIFGVQGNHEIWLKSVLNGGSMNDGVYQPIMGGLATLRSYGLSRGDPDRVGNILRSTVPKEHKDYLNKLPPFRSILVGEKKYLLVHTGVTAEHLSRIEISARDRVDKTPLTDEQKVAILHAASPDVYYWVGSRPRDPDNVAEFEEHVQIFGHTPIPDVMVQPHYIALDTGSGTCNPHKLSAVIILPDYPGIEIIESK